MTTIYPYPFTVPSPKPIPAELLRESVRRFTRQDLWAVMMIAEHQVLTTAQLTTLGFRVDQQVAERRLRILARRGWLDRFGTITRTGDIVTVWCLGPLGADITSAPAGPYPSPARTYRRRERLRTSGDLELVMETNQFFVDLAAHARTTAHADLREWWSPRTCHAVTTPDRRQAWHGAYAHRGERHGFWLEPDPGETSVAALAGRVHHYLDIAARTGLATLLFRTTDPQREQDLHKKLARLNLRQLTVATTHPDAGHPANSVWLPAGGSERIALHQLPTTEQVAHPNDDAFILDAQNLAPHPLHDPERPGEEAIVNGEYSYTRQP